MLTLGFARQVKTYLHERFRIVSCPLRESSALREPAYFGERCDTCNAGLHGVNLNFFFNVRSIPLPSIDVIQNCCSTLWAMYKLEVLVNPLHKVVFEYALDELVEEVWGEEYMYVGARKIICEGLHGQVKAQFKCKIIHST